jgi:hypothetical protein
MIKVENIEVFNFEGAIRGLRNPMNSWSKSDSHRCSWVKLEKCNECKRLHDYISGAQVADKEHYCIGKNDLDLMKRLFKAGTEHRKYLRQIFVSMDITAPLYFVSELDTYKVGTTRNSCSFMHKGTAKPFEITDFSIHDDRVYEILSCYDKRQYPLIYKYDTDEYKIYTCWNGRKYKVYRNGKVVSCAFEYVDTMNRHRVFTERECNPSLTDDGYYEINLGGRCGERWLLHRLVATVWLPNEDTSYTVNHIDGNKGNNCVENLEWVPLEENIRKGYENGLYSNVKSLHARYRRWKIGHTVVDPFVRTQIIKDHNSGMTCKQVAEKYDITISQANNIISFHPCDNNDLFMLCYRWETILDTLNQLRDEYLDTKDDEVFQQIRCLLPSGYNQRFTLTMNYENVFSIIKQRSGHRLTEWNEFIKILKTLPYVKEIGGFED